MRVNLGGGTFGQYIAILSSTLVNILLWAKIIPSASQSHLNIFDFPNPITLRSKITLIPGTGMIHIYSTYSFPFVFFHLKPHLTSNM